MRFSQVSPVSESSAEKVATLAPATKNQSPGRSGDDAAADRSCRSWHLSTQSPCSQGGSRATVDLVARGDDSASSSNYALTYVIVGASLTAIAAGSGRSSPGWLSAILYTLAIALLLVGLIEGVRQQRRVRGEQRDR
ncbi:hypothetical protein LQ327_26330 [Actinomycetospora endophytica]|uniref:Uncharacterized protein n=1 Tax=Actinomycetospora endophytica TaxID=2291215 RepID=A0ABS8PF78_9PSEU|nr:hypothetical protein [Actinomycetospora endophytica]MCD2196893.1 hypothetical protein [Actinomycetospora endophytica]